MHGAREGEATDEVAEATSWRTGAVPFLAALGTGGDKASLLSEELFRMRLAEEGWLTGHEASVSGLAGLASGGATDGPC